MVRQLRNAALAATLILAIEATAGAEAGRYNSVASNTNTESGRNTSERNNANTEAGPSDKREVTWLRDGCELLVEDPANDGEMIDYWAAVCHGYAIAARDYTQIVTGFSQMLEGRQLAVCIESEDVTGRDVARVFVEYVDRNPEASGQPAVAVMLAAITDHWCAELLSRTTKSSEQVP